MKTLALMLACVLLASCGPQLSELAKQEQPIALSPKQLENTDFVLLKQKDGFQEKSILKISGQNCQLIILAQNTQIYSGDVQLQGPYLSVRLDRLEDKVLEVPVVYNFRSYVLKDGKSVALANVANNEVWYFGR
jgi:hypothetical protein